MSVVLTERARILRVHRRISNEPENPSKIMGFLFPITKGMTVLDALLWVKEHKAQGLAFRYSCRMGICGSCGILINGEPELACETQITALSGDAIEVAPLPNFPVVRDLVTEFQGFFSHHTWVMPYLIRRNPVETGERELLQTEEEKLRYYQFTMCIMCGLCNAACPIVGVDQEYLGPQALTQAYRLAVDSRDEGWSRRKASLDTVHGCWGCTVAGSCSAACPKGVDPALAIQLLKRKVLLRFARER
ncbi:MAG TPA: succinate dehydrogenase iron-sulfur subunit [Candidatus Bathyarchaeia archaeon]|nr:succinate dehydrogenase iron-sulfur subunit [Candidatus Bathyarchaeia archaeon]